MRISDWSSDVCSSDLRNVKTLNDLPAVAAGLSVQNTASNRNDTTFSIRGQGQTFGQNSPGVVTYFADVPDFGKQFFDLENVQVLRSEEHTSELQSLMRISYAVFCLKKKKSTKP